MSHHLLRDNSVVQSQLRNDIPEFTTGCVVNVHYKIQEGNKERVQIFSGVVIKKRAGNGLDGTFSVLKNATAGVKVVRTFPIHSPYIVKLELVSGLQRARRSKLYNLKTVKDPLKALKVKPLKAKAERQAQSKMQAVTA
jgi:large subunit ribosomal protein L19